MPGSDALTEKQKRMLEFIVEFMETHSYPPSIRDIGRACGISSTSVVDYNLKVLEQKGWIRRDPEISRGIEVVGQRRFVRPRTVSVPLIGTIAAGQPIPVPGSESFSSAPEDLLELPTELTRGKENIFALRVKGTSMIDALINDGDIVLLEQTETAENGEMVAAWLKDEKETTLKRFYREGARVRLQPMNSTMKPIYVDADNVAIQGRVVGVIRQL
jgi:repressor LexA